MKTILALVLILYTFCISAQEYVDVEVRGINKPTVLIDYGDGATIKGFTTKNHTKDNGDEFKGPIDVLTYFEGKGWELIEWSANFESNVSIRVYLFRLPLTGEDISEGTEGITQNDKKSPSERALYKGRAVTDGSAGINFSLTGRNPVSIPKPEYYVQEEGKVVVNIRVNRDGVVTWAEAGAQGTNTLNKELLEASRKAALKARFNRSADAAFTQQGTITYHFVQQ